MLPYMPDDGEEIIHAKFYMCPCGGGRRFTMCFMDSVKKDGSREEKLVNTSAWALKRVYKECNTHPFLPDTISRHTHSSWLDTSRENRVSGP